MYFLLTCGLFLPFFGTLLGAAFIFFMKSSLHPLAEQVMLGFAAGVMTAASIWSLLLPSMEQASNLGVFSLSRQRQAFWAEWRFWRLQTLWSGIWRKKGNLAPATDRGREA